MLGSLFGVVNKGECCWSIEGGQMAREGEFREGDSWEWLLDNC